MPTHRVHEDPARGPIGRPPAVPVMFPSEFPVADLAALAARAGYRVKRKTMDSNRPTQPPASRRAVQMCVSEAGGGDTLYVLADDGTIWASLGAGLPDKWVQIPPIPQPEQLMANE